MRDIQARVAETYGTEVSPDLISRVTDAVADRARSMRWPIVFLQALVSRMRPGRCPEQVGLYRARHARRRSQGSPGNWARGQRGREVWLKVLSELKNRGAQDSSQSWTKARVACPALCRQAAASIIGAGPASSAPPGSGAGGGGQRRCRFRRHAHADDEQGDAQGDHDIGHVEYRPMP